uniref:Macrophage mannose receptor 1-like n=1 Tax=Seriola dumerili TaxID=41447 RepID=A0A3B4T7C2_SERDU
MTDIKRLHDSVKNQTEAWIGLYSEPGNKRTWHWSLPGVEYNENKAKLGNVEPNSEHCENCVWMKYWDQEWKTLNCHEEKKGFICYNESSSDKFCLITEEKNWRQAQSYCREHHTDLASGDQLEDDKLKEEIQDSDELWIGLFRDTWTWSDGSNFSFRHWDQGPFGDGRGQKNCTFLKTSGEWGSDRCHERKPFFCYEEKLILIQESKTWDEALDHCREHHRDLVSITNVHQQRWVQQRAKNASSPFVWLGLRYTCALDLWFWVNDHLVCYDNWVPGQEPDACVHSAAMARDGHKWFKKADTNTFDFICAV